MGSRRLRPPRPRPRGRGHPQAQCSCSPELAWVRLDLQVLRVKAHASNPAELLITTPLHQP